MGSGDDFWPDSSAHVPRVVPSAASTRIEWSAGEELTYEEWVADGALFEEQGSGWAIGDWVAYGVARFGNIYGAAALATGIPRPRLLQLWRIASQFAPARRRGALTLEHHGVVVELDGDAQEWWLDRAESERYSARELRAEFDVIQRAAAARRYGRERRRQDRRDQPDRRARALDPFDREPSTTQRSVTCPHCGGRVDL
jgi:hypothetical protein